MSCMIVDLICVAAGTSKYFIFVHFQVHAICMGTSLCNCISDYSVAMVAADNHINDCILHMHAVGNMGGFVGPSIIGLLLAKTNSFALPMSMMGMCLATAGLALFTMTKVLMKVNAR